jgi:hypothetical protein
MPATVKASTALLQELEKSLAEAGEDLVDKVKVRGACSVSESCR